MNFAVNINAKNFVKYVHTDVFDCYDTPKMLILVFIEFRESQE